MAVGARGLKDGMGRSFLNVGSIVSDSISGLTTQVGTGEVGNAELATDAVTRAKIDDEAMPAGHFTLGTNGASVFVGFSGAGAGLTAVGSALAIVITPLAATTEPPHVVDYSASGFNASGAAAVECMYLAIEEP
jgi:hypothetical protein